MKPMDTTQILLTAECLSKLIRELCENRGMVEAEITDLERAHNEVIHEMEKPSCKYKERNRLATQLANVRKERRKLKDWLYDNRQYFDYIGSDEGKKIRNMLDNLVGRGRKVRKMEEADYDKS